MKKSFITISIIVGILAFGAGIYNLGKIFNQPSEEEIQEARQQIEKEFNTAEAELPEDEQLNLSERFPDNLKESQIQEIIHGMSHQKVEAEAKWGEYQITQERVERLLEVAILNEAAYQHGKTYVTILEKWAKGDFSTADKDHNAIWQILGGTVGEATGLLSPVEEQEYIERHFKNKTPKKENGNNEENTEE